VFCAILCCAAASEAGVRSKRAAARLLRQRLPPSLSGLVQVSERGGYEYEPHGKELLTKVKLCRLCRVYVDLKDLAEKMEAQQDKDLRTAMERGRAEVLKNRAMEARRVSSQKATSPVYGNSPTEPEAIKVDMQLESCLGLAGPLKEACIAKVSPNFGAKLPGPPKLPGGAAPTVPSIPNAPALPAIPAVPPFGLSIKFPPMPPMALPPGALLPKIGAPFTMPQPPDLQDLKFKMPKPVVAPPKPQLPLPEPSTLGEKLLANAQASDAAASASAGAGAGAGAGGLPPPPSPDSPPSPSAAHLPTNPPAGEPPHHLPERTIPDSQAFNVPGAGGGGGMIQRHIVGGKFGVDAAEASAGRFEEDRNNTALTTGDDSSIARERTDRKRQQSGGGMGVPDALLLELESQAQALQRSRAVPNDPMTRMLTDPEASNGKPWDPLLHKPFEPLVRSPASGQPTKEPTQGKMLLIEMYICANEIAPWLLDALFKAALGGDDVVVGCTPA